MLYHWSSWARVRVAIVSGCGDPLLSLARSLQQVHAAIGCAFTEHNTVAAHIIPFNTQSAACLQLPAQLLQVCLAVITSLLQCILFLIFVTGDLGFCQLVTPLLQNKEANQGQHCGNSFILALFVLPGHSCTCPVCLWMEDQDSLFQCKVLSRSSKWINKWRDARDTYAWNVLRAGAAHSFRDWKWASSQCIRKQEPLCFVSRHPQSPPSLLIWKNNCQDGFSPLQGSMDHIAKIAFGSYYQLLQCCALLGESYLSLFIKMYHELGDKREKPQALSAELRAEGQLDSCLDCLCQTQPERGSCSRDAEVSAERSAAPVISGFLSCVVRIFPVPGVCCLHRPTAVPGACWSLCA